MTHTKEISNSNLVISAITDPNFKVEKSDEPYLRITNDDRNAPGMGMLAKKEDAIKLAKDILTWAFQEDDKVYQTQMDKVIDVAGRMYLGLPTQKWERMMVIAWMQKNP